jgi:hypothetical protein
MMDMARKRNSYYIRQNRQASVDGGALCKRCNLLSCVPRYSADPVYPVYLIIHNRPSVRPRYKHLQTDMSHHVVTPHFCLLLETHFQCRRQDLKTRRHPSSSVTMCHESQRRSPRPSSSFSSCYKSHSPSRLIPSTHTSAKYVAWPQPPQLRRI